MSEYPILFSVAMVRAILDGRKTQTRRPVKWTGMDDIDDDGWPLREDEYGDFHRFRCPYGEVRDTLWVREAWSMCAWGGSHDYVGIKYAAGGPPLSIDNVQNSARQAWLNHGCKGRPSIHMFRWASRISLRITDVRVERVRSISNADVLAEGIEQRHIEKNRKFFHPGDVHALAFAELWDSINGKQKPNKPDLSWAANPYVWVVTFGVIK